MKKEYSNSPFVIASCAVNKLGDFKTHEGVCANVRSGLPLSLAVVNHLIAIPIPNKIHYTCKCLLCCGCYVLSDEETTELKGIRSSGGYFHCVKCALLKPTPDESTDFRAMNLGFQVPANQKFPQTNLVNAATGPQTTVLDVHSPVHSALR